MRNGLAPLLFAAVVCAHPGLTGCGGDDSGRTPLGSNPNGGFQSAGGGGDGGFASGPGGLAGGTGQGTGAAGQPAQACTNLCLKQVTCAGAAKTTLTGTVYDPAGKVPLYNAVVYVPNAAVAPMTTGASCDRCGTTLSGSPLVATLTDTKGHFILENVPVGAALPLVIQIGKWRRQVTVPTVTKCGNTPVPAALTRLPRNKSEGDIPHIAIATGGADSMECLPRRMGIDDAEFTTEAGHGRINLYRGFDSTGGMKPQVPSGDFTQALGGAMFTSASTLWGDLAHLSAYDIVILSCEGALNPDSKSVAARQAMYDYEKKGGRVFASHWHRYWFSDGPAPVPTIGKWTDYESPQPIDPRPGTINTTFPKGKAFSDWLLNVGASTVPGQLVIHAPRDNVSMINASIASEWVSISDSNAPGGGGGRGRGGGGGGGHPGIQATEFVSYNAPIGVPDTMQCGRAVYSDLHVSVSSGDMPGNGTSFPDLCATGDLSDQEKALEFLLFDLSACLTSDTKPPPVPPIIPIVK